MPIGASVRYLIRSGNDNGFADRPPSAAVTAGTAFQARAAAAGLTVDDSLAGVAACRNDPHQHTLTMSGLGSNLHRVVVSPVFPVARNSQHTLQGVMHWEHRRTLRPLADPHSTVCVI